jgi:hypothetical protein
MLRDVLPCVRAQHLPRCASLYFNLPEETIVRGTPAGRLLSGARSGRTPRHEDRGRATLEHRCITRSRIVGSITRHVVNGIGNLGEQSGQRLTVVVTTRGEFPRDHLMNFYSLQYPTTSL